MMPGGPDPMPDPATVEAVAPNLKRRLSGVTSTLERVVPVQARTLRIAALAPKLAAGVPRIGWRDLRHFWHPPPGRSARIWHARRNIEMLAGVLLRDLLRTKLRLVFTSASQRRHTRWTRWLIARMDGVISTSARTAAYLERPSTVIHHGIDADVFRPAEDRAAARAALGLPALRMIGCFGRIRSQKGTDVFVEALIRVLPAHADWGGVVLGRALGKDQSFLDDLKTRVKQAGLEGRILFPGEVDTSATSDWYRALDLYIAPQRWEGFGVTPIEAMATGVPVIATRVGAFEELVDAGVTGDLVPPGDVEAMAKAVATHLAMSDDARKAMQGAARAHAVAAFSLEREAARINAVYEAVWRG